MRKRPISVTIIALVFLATGLAGLAALAAEIVTHHGVGHDLVWVGALRFVAVVCGVFLLRGHNWARWLAVVWLAVHVMISAFHPPFELLVHGLLLIVTTWMLFRRPASGYFRGTGAVILSNESQS